MRLASQRSSDKYGYEDAQRLRRSTIDAGLFLTLLRFDALASYLLDKHID